MVESVLTNAPVVTAGIAHYKLTSRFLIAKTYIRPTAPVIQKVSERSVVSRMLARHENVTVVAAIRD